MHVFFSACLVIILSYIIQQICWYFPIKNQLEALLSVPEYREALTYEYHRPLCGNPNLMSDVYDSPRWADRIGRAATNDLVRIVVQLCVDGIPAYKRKHALSVKPVQFLVLSLPPWLRYQAQHMLISMLIPARLKGDASKKYYDFAAKEMNELHLLGVRGVRVLVYGDTLDAPGRRELLNMEAVTAFYPCPHCLHTAQPGVRKQTYGGFRRFLSKNSPWRARQFVHRGQTYMFRDVETRLAPIRRTERNVSAMVLMARPGRPCCGHKGLRFLHEWCGIDWEGSACDPMHDKKTFTDMLLRALVGTRDSGIYSGWSAKKDEQHRLDCEVYGIFPQFYQNRDSLPPWRMTKLDLHIADMRVRNMWWPHYMDKLCKPQGSFWKMGDVMWKAVHKRYILSVLLPTCLHGLSVKAVHNAVLMVSHSLRKLEGQCISLREAVALGVVPGDSVIDKTCIPSYRRELIHGLVLVEGSFPVDHINPNAHHLVHYGDETLEKGLLDLIAMWCFERNNKRVKDLVRNPARALPTLAKNVKLDIATRMDNYSSGAFETRAPPPFVLSVPSRCYALSKRARFDLGMKGVTSFRSVRAFDVARILGVHFRAGEWGRRRCGSVVTFIYAGISRYCIVNKFLRVQGKLFVHVTWLSKPHYPYAPNKLVATVHMLTDAQQRVHSCVIAIDRIEPCSVAVIPNTDGIHFFMLCGKGCDRSGVTGM